MWFYNCWYSILEQNFRWSTCHFTGIFSTEENKYSFTFLVLRNEAIIYDRRRGNSRGLHCKKKIARKNLSFSQNCSFWEKKFPVFEKRTDFFDFFFSLICTVCNSDLGLFSGFWWTVYCTNQNKISNCIFFLNIQNLLPSISWYYWDPFPGDFWPYELSYSMCSQIILTFHCAQLPISFLLH